MTYTHMNIPWGIRHDDMEFSKYRIIKSSKVAVDPLGRQLPESMVMERGRSRRKYEHTVCLALPSGPIPISNLNGLRVLCASFHPISLFITWSSFSSQSTSKCKYRHGAFSFPLPPAPRPEGRETRVALPDGNGGIDGDCAYVGSE